jgi:hypothetical protein
VLLSFCSVTLNKSLDPWGLRSLVSIIRERNQMPLGLLMSVLGRSAGMDRVTLHVGDIRRSGLGEITT